MVEKEKLDVERKAVMVADRFRTVEKVLLCENLQDFLIQGSLKGPRLSERSNFLYYQIREMQKLSNDEIKTFFVSSKSTKIILWNFSGSAQCGIIPSD